MLRRNYSSRSQRFFCCYDIASGQWYLEQRKEKWYSIEQRPYCANCGKLKGSKTEDYYYPERPCLDCGSSKTKLRDYNDNEIGWDKWVALENEAAIAELARVRSLGGTIA